MPEFYITDVQLAARFGVHRATIWRWANDRTMGFPQPVVLSPGCTRWKQSKIDAWEAAKVGAANG